MQIVAREQKRSKIKFPVTSKEIFKIIEYSHSNYYGICIHLSLRRHDLARSRQEWKTLQVDFDVKNYVTLKIENQEPESSIRNHPNHLLGPAEYYEALDISALQEIQKTISE